MEDIWKLLAGVGIFLFGMYLLEEAIKQLAGKSFKRLIRNYTDNHIKAILTGTFSTAILQSSSAVSLIVIAFVGAGIMKLGNAIGVIVGSNLGTTLTSWIVASLGFKFSIEALAMPTIAVGGLGLIFLGKEGKYSNFSKLLVGFGFLFMGLNYMKNSVTDIVENIPIEILQDRNFFVYIISGFLLTGLVQSSSASMALTLSAVYSQLISFDEACAMVIGSNIGTTTTVIIGTLGATTAMKRVAFSHFFFNLITAIAAIISFPALIYAVTEIFQLKNDLVTGLVLFHTIFNLLGVAIFIPFTNPFARFIKKIYPDKKTYVTKFIHHTPTDIPEAGISAMKQECFHLLYQTMGHNLKILYIDETLALKVLKDKDGNAIEIVPELEKNYQVIKNLQSDIFGFSSQIQGHELTKGEANSINKLLHCVRYASASAKTMKDYKHEFEELYNSDNAILTEYYQYFRKNMITLYIKLNELYEIDDQQLLQIKLDNILQNLKIEDKKFNKIILEKLTQKLISENYVNNLLYTQRGYNQSSRQLVKAFYDYSVENRED